MFDELFVMPHRVVSRLHCCSICNRRLTNAQEGLEIFRDNSWQPVCQECSTHSAPKLQWMAGSRASQPQPTPWMHTYNY